MDPLSAFAFNGVTLTIDRPMLNPTTPPSLHRRQFNVGPDMAYRLPCLGFCPLASVLLHSLNQQLGSTPWIFHKSKKPAVAEFKSNRKQDRATETNHKKRNMTALNQLVAVQRHITTNNSDGMSVFASSISPDPPSTQLPDGTRITFCYGNQRFPVNLADDQDLDSYQHLIKNPPGIVIPNGFAFRILDLPPSYDSAKHRTISVNFNVVMQGQLELTLNSGEKRQLGPGDSAIQRGVEHSWKNTSSTEWARMAAVVIPAELLQLGGVAVKGTGIPGMDAS